METPLFTKPADAESRKQYRIAASAMSSVIKFVKKKRDKIIDKIVVDFDNIDPDMEAEEKALAGIISLLEKNFPQEPQGYHMFPSIPVANVIEKVYRYEPDGWQKQMVADGAKKRHSK